MSTRRASHAGSWYTESPRELNSQLDGWLSLADPATHSPARAIIAPHAGYTYCGSCSAFAYRQVDPSKVKRVFILGPSHHVRLSGCALSSTSKYRTPLYDLPIDQRTYDELFATGCFERMNLATDEDEHSIEMQIPYVAKVMEDRRDQFTICPVLVGSLSADKEQQYGKIFAKYLADPHNLFVISSDFCHWGQRFRFTHYDQTCGQIYQSVEKLDRMGMELIEMMTPTGFTDYLKKFGNTICGRHPIGVLLNAIQALQKSGGGHKMSLKFLKYAQSSQCRNMQDSSVSYAAASLVVE